MASKLFSRSRPLNFDTNPSPETMFHFPISPSEPGKFDFYRVHVANQNNHIDSTYSDNADTPTLYAPSSTQGRRWTPFADIAAPAQSQSSMSTNSSSLNPIRASRSQTISLPDSNVLPNITRIQNEPIQPASSFSSLTDLVRNAMSQNQLSVAGNPMRRPVSGTILTTKDLNHLSPQSM